MTAVSQYYGFPSLTYQEILKLFADIVVELEDEVSDFTKSILCKNSSEHLSEGEERILREYFALFVRFANRRLENRFADDGRQCVRLLRVPDSRYDSYCLGVCQNGNLHLSLHKGSNPLLLKNMEPTQDHKETIEAVVKKYPLLSAHQAESFFVIAVGE